MSFHGYELSKKVDDTGESVFRFIVFRTTSDSYVYVSDVFEDEDQSKLIRFAKKNCPEIKTMRIRRLK